MTIYDRYTTDDPPVYLSSVRQPTVPGQTVPAPYDGGIQAISKNTSAASMAEINYFPRSDRPPAPGEAYVWQAAAPENLLVNGASIPQGQWVPPDISALRTAAFARVRAEASTLLDELIPTPWDRLKRSAEYETWIEETAKPAVSAMLAEAETAIAGASTVARLNSIHVAWDEEE